MRNWRASCSVPPGYSPAGTSVISPHHVLSRNCNGALSAIHQWSAFALRAEPEENLEVLGESICLYCGVGCRLRFEGDGRRVLRVRGVESAAAYLGGICAKGA